MAEHPIVRRKIRDTFKDLSPNQRRLDTGLSEEDYMRPIKETIFERTVFIMKKYPETTGNDNLLTARYYWYFYGRKFGMPFKELLRLPAPETISRCRRKAKELGIVDYTPKTRTRRAQREQAIRRNINEVPKDDEQVSVMT